MKWDDHGDMRRVIDETGRVIARVRAHPYYHEWEAYIQGDCLGVYQTKEQAIAAVEDLATPKPDGKLERAAKILDAFGHGVLADAVRELRDRQQYGDFTRYCPACFSAIEKPEHKTEEATRQGEWPPKDMPPPMYP